jgi:aspartyl aminopeptidase
MKKGAEGKRLLDKLSFEPKLAWDRFDKEEQEKMYAFADGYRTFLTRVKTERETNKFILEQARKHGFSVASKVPHGLSPGAKLYFDNRGRSSALVVLGQKPISEGFRLVGSHIDAPRLDLKARPLYEDEGMVLFKTQYYGGIKKYQWPVQPLALHGVIVLANGEQIDLRLGEEPGEPVFYISDLLPHLASKQMAKKAKEVVTGEALNIIIGSRPYPDNGDLKERAKLGILKLLYDSYGISEEDLVSADLSAVPAGAAKDVGFDRSFVGGYGQDDRVCVYASLLGILTLAVPQYTAICYYADREEVGSVGNTGARSRFFENVVAELVHGENTKTPDLKVRRALAHAEALSADVNAALDPTYPQVSDKLNAARVGYGISLTKYTGARGKSGASEASAEFLGKVRRLLNDHNIPWQPGDLGKVDEGGGGTIAQFLADLGMDVLDAGVPILSMHSPFELASKADLYAAYKTYKAFLGSGN